MAASKTKYVVLMQDAEDDSTYLKLSTGVEAHSAETAIRVTAKEQLAEEALKKGAVLVAVPLSNWTEEPVGIYVPPAVLRVGSEIPGQITVEEAVAEAEEEANDGD